MHLEVKYIQFAWQADYEMVAIGKLSNVIILLIP